MASYVFLRGINGHKETLLTVRGGDDLRSTNGYFRICFSE